MMEELPTRWKNFLQDGRTPQKIETFLHDGAALLAGQTAPLLGLEGDELLLAHALRNHLLLRVLQRRLYLLVHGPVQRLWVRTNHQYEA